MGSNHDHGSAAVREGHQKKLIMALALTGSFMIAEVIGAWITGSLALLSDASHMFTDTAALAISLIALQIANARRIRKEPSAMRAWRFWLRRSTPCCSSWWRCTSCTRLPALFHAGGDRYRGDDVDRNRRPDHQPNLDAPSGICEQREP